MAFTSPAASSGDGPTAFSQSASGLAGVAVRMRSTCLAVASAASARRTTTDIGAGSWMAQATLGLAMALRAPQPVITDSSPAIAQIDATSRSGAAARPRNVVISIFPPGCDYLRAGLPLLP